MLNLSPRDERPSGTHSNKGRPRLGPVQPQHHHILHGQLVVMEHPDLHHSHLDPSALPEDQAKEQQNRKHGDDNFSATTTTCTTTSEESDHLPLWGSFPPPPPLVATNATDQRRLSRSQSPPAKRAQSPLLTSTSSEQCLARLLFPESHRQEFKEALSSPPDPRLKIKKKSVRFNGEETKGSLERRERTTSSDDSRPSSKQSTPTITTANTRSPSSKTQDQPSARSGTNGKTTSNSNSGTSSKGRPHFYYSTTVVPLRLPAVDKDPEEKMAELMELKQMKIRQEDLFHLKDQIFQMNHSLEEKQVILDEISVERKSLQSELSRTIAMVKQIQRDFELATQTETQLVKERDQLSAQLTQLRDHDYRVIKQEVDTLRSKKNLRPLATLEQEQAEFMGRYLEQRRGQWRDDGLTDPSTSTSSPPPPPPLPLPQSSQIPTPPPLSSSSSSSLQTSTSHTSSLRGKDSRHAGASSSRSDRTSRSVHQRRPSLDRSASSFRSSRHKSRSQSPAAQSSSRAERSKKRSRY